ncbi:hypothetical protein QGN29_03935 [Temperatibacter marinus]|uniref:Dienelactone hydrolase n=1 Tax=Temperatibacter marinus TaxID=1456591 RepID=A0AA52EJ81_9PROT|nr:hypothetical protein [Temperatibacter marinus]WND03522.1 hypothetical protein QGN29_03935 [Temperatibacter marinus]
MTTEDMPFSVRALFRAIHVTEAEAPYDTISAKIYYPATFGNSDLERNTGMIPVNEEKAPLPVVLLLPGINVGPESYAWLAKALAKEGNLVVTYSWIAEEMPGYVSLTPGLDMESFSPEGHGKGPSCPAIAPLLEELKSLNKEGQFAGLIDMESLYIGGHSAGGTVALMNANRQWFPSIKGVFSYAAHTGASVALGWPEDTVLPLGDDVPVLLTGGTKDGVIASSSHRYGKAEDDSPTARIERTFVEGVKAGNGSALVFIEGANHFSCVYPQDDTTGRPFLDQEETIDSHAFREFYAALVGMFIRHQGIQEKTIKDCAKGRVSVVLQTK